jgi:hypothetical protein
MIRVRTDGRSMVKKRLIGWTDTTIRVHAAVRKTLTIPASLLASAYEVIE